MSDNSIETVGVTVEVKGSGAKPYRVKNCGPGGFSCTCPAWRNQNFDPARRTCKHIIKLRGEKAEQERIGSTAELPSRKPEGEAKEAPPVLLADKWDGESNVTGWWMSEKLDGVRAWWDGKQFLSRNGNLFLAPPWFVAGLPSVPLDGELWIARKQFNAAQSAAMSQTSGEEWRRMRYVVFDVPAHGGEFEARQRFLADLLSRNKPAFASILEQQRCRDVDHLLEEQVRVEGLGGEGLMLRQPSSKYVGGRSATLLKVKKFHDAEAVVIGHDPGLGRHKGRLGALVCRLPDGTVFNVGTGFSDKQRETPPAIGSVVNFKYQELTPYGAPRFPVYVGVRLEAGSLPEVKPAAKPKTAVSAAVPAAPPAAAKPDEVRRCEYEDRFWEASRTGATVRLTFGVKGGKQSSKETTYATAAAAKEAVEDAVAEKSDDGFIEVDAVARKPLKAAVAEPPAPAAPPAPKPATAPAAAKPTGGRRRFEFSEGTSDKFWEVWTEGKLLFTRFGRIGSEGQISQKDLADEAAAKKEADKLVRQKTGKGYQEKT